MPEPIRIKFGLLKLLKKATHQSVENLSSSATSVDIDIDQAALVAILVLLRYHPQNEVGKFYIDKINRILQWKEEDASRDNIGRRRKVGSARSKIVFGASPDPGKDPYGDALDAILEYGKYLHRLKEGEQKRTRHELHESHTES